MRGAIAPAGQAEAEVMAAVQAHPLMEGLDLACGVSTAERYVVPAVGDERFHVVAYDFGVKAHSPRVLAERGCRVTVIPADTPVEEVLASPPDGLFVSNGPGDPAAVPVTPLQFGAQFEARDGAASGSQLVDDLLDLGVLKSGRAGHRR
jgi:carbamoyl-phosphate synthase small subunit